MHSPGAARNLRGRSEGPPRGSRPDGGTWELRPRVDRADRRWRPPLGSVEIQPRLMCKVTRVLARLGTGVCVMQGFLRIVIASCLILPGAAQAESADAGLK